MKIFHVILLAVAFVSTIIALSVVYMDITHPFATSFVVFYVVYLLVFAVYIFITAIITIRKLHWAEIRTRVLKFIILFLVFSASNYIFNYFFRPEKNSTYGFLVIALGLSFGLSFLDVVFNKQTKQ